MIRKYCTLEILQALVKKDPVRRQVLRVKGCLAGSKAEGILEQGDMLLAISGEPVTCFRDVENACQRADASHDEAGAALKVTVFRQVRRSYFWNCAVIIFHCYESALSGSLLIS